MSLSKVLTTLLLVAALLTTGFLLLRETGEHLTYYYEVDQVDPAEIGSRRVRISGDVVAGTIVADPEAMRTEFAIVGASGERRVRVVYTGVVPDIFKPGIQVVVTGRFDGSGRFQADELLAKCPSKYQPADDPADFAGVVSHPTEIPIGE